MFVLQVAIIVSYDCIIIITRAVQTDMHAWTNRRHYMEPGLICQQETW